MPTQANKPVTSIVSNRQETSQTQIVNMSGLSFSLCDRTKLTEVNTNYFSSFNVPVSSSKLPSGSTLAMNNPEILQLNVDKIIICPIPKEYYSEIIDGRSITFTVPQLSGATDMSAKTIVSSTYTTLQKKDNNILIGNNIAFLFCDEINKPYSGTTNGGTTSHSANTTWNKIPFSTRPAAVPYSDLTPSIDINTDKRPYPTVSYAFQVPAIYPTNTDQGYNYDIPVGFVSLDKGFMVLTHPKIVNNIPWGQGYNLITNTSNSLSGTNNIWFSDPTVSQIIFTDINVNFKTSVVCLALPGEFFFTNNPSWDLAKNAQEFLNNTNNYDPLQITEIGLYNSLNQMVAIAKLSEPVEKNYTNLLTFNLDINV